MYDWYQLLTAKYQPRNNKIHPSTLITHLCGLFLFWESMTRCNETILYISTIDMNGNVENMQTLGSRWRTMYIQSLINCFWCGVNKLFTSQISRAITAYSWDALNQMSNLRDLVFTLMESFWFCMQIWRTPRFHYSELLFLNQHLENNFGAI